MEGQRVKTRVLLVGDHEYTMSPLGKRLGELYSRLDVSRFEVYFAATTPHDLVAGDSNLTFHIEFSVRRPFSSIKKLRTLINECQPNLIHTHGLRASLFVRFVDAISENRVICTLDGRELGKGAFGKIEKLFAKVLRRKSVHFVAFSKWDLARLTTWGLVNKGKSTVIPNASSIEDLGQAEVSIYEPFVSAIRKVAEVDEGNLLFLFRHDKGQSAASKSAIGAFLCSAAARSGAKLGVVADKEDDILRNYLDAKGVTDVVKIILPRKDMTPVFLAADVYVQLVSDGIAPQDVFDAASASCAIIASGIGDLCEMFPAAGQAILLKSCNGSELTDAFDALTFMTDDNRLSMAQAAKQRMQTAYSQSIMTKSHEVMYIKLCNAQTIETLL